MFNLEVLLTVFNLFVTIHCSSNSNPKIWNNAKKCMIKNSTEGRCITFEYCPAGRGEEYDKSCGNGIFPNLCCESKVEDFHESNYGQVAKQECIKSMENIPWKMFPYVFGGRNARPQEFTFMAALGYGNSLNNIKFHCGGSLISDKHVLTAAHCLFSPSDGPVKYVLLGDLDINITTDDAEPQYLFVQNVTVHPDYKRGSSYHDIAILHLNKAARFSNWVQPACLDFGQLPVEVNKTDLYATGWGYLDTEGNRPSVMQEVTLIEYGFDLCRKTYPHTKKLYAGIVDTQICAGGRDTLIKDTCQGDSGGPLTRTNNDIRYERYKGYILVGITSFGKLCGFTNSPGVYTRVNNYVPWIESIVWPEAKAKNIQEQQIISTSDLIQISNDSMGIKQQSLDLQDGTQFITESEPHISLQGKPENNLHPTDRRTRKPIHLVDVHYFVDRK